MTESSCWKTDVAGRLAILNVHAAKKPLGDDVDLDSLSRTTAGFTGADLENLLNEAAINAAKHGRKFIKNEDVNYAFVKLVSVLKREARLFQKKRKRLQHTMSQDMQYYSMYFLMSDLFIRYQ